MLSSSHPAVDENTPLHPPRPSSMRNPGARKPSTSRASFAVRNNTPSARTSPRLSSSAAVKTRDEDATVEIQVHLPTSDPVEEVEETTTVQGPPTPPASQSPPTLSSRRASSSQPIPAALNSSQTSHALLHPSALPIPARARSRSRSTSIKPKTSLPAPVTPLRSTASPAPKSQRRESNGKKLAPRPSETLEQVPLIGLESEGEDPLILKGGEEMRGLGEGKPIWRGSPSAASGRGTRSASRSRSRSTGVQVEMIDKWEDAELAPLESGTVEEEQEMGGYEDWGAGFASSDGESEANTVVVPGALPQERVAAKEYHESTYDYIVPLAPESSSPPPPTRLAPSRRPSPAPAFAYDLPSPFLRRPLEVPQRSSSAIAFSARHPSTALPSEPATSSRAASIEPKQEEDEEEEEEDTRDHLQEWVNGGDFFRSSTSPPGLDQQAFRTPSLTASSPDLEEPSPATYGSEEEEGEDEVVLVGQSMSPNEDGKRSESPPQVALPAPSTLPRPMQPTEDATMESPVRRSPLPRSTNEEDAAMASPLRRPLLDEDSRMASPSPRRQAGAGEDAVMGSPSPVRRRAEVPASLERLRLGGKVGEGRLLLAKKLAGLGCVVEMGGTPVVKLGSMATTQAGDTATPTASTTQSAPLASTSTAPPPATQSTSTPLVHLQNSQSNTFTPQLHSTTPRTASRRSSRPRPSHPTLPVIEVSSTDPRAAARAAAILKVYHEYVEQGTAGSAGVEQERGEESEESDEEKKEMLEEAEEEVLARVRPRHTPSSVSSMWGAGEMPGALKASPRPSRDKEARSIPASVDEREWTSAEWRRLEGTLVDETRAAKKEGRESTVDDVVWEFLENEGLGEEDCEGAWEWSKLIVRVNALRARRARDSARRSSRASSIASPLPPTLDAELLQASTRAAASAAGSSLAPPQDRHRSFSPAQSSTAARKVRVVESSPEPEPSSDEDDSDLDHDPAEDTFFERRNVHVAPPHVEEDAPLQPPLALAGSRFAHLYEDPVAKPPLPAQSWEAPRRPEDDSVEYEDDSFDRSSLRSATPEEGGSRQAPPSSARKLFSYLGSFVRRPSASLGPEMHLQASLVVPTFASTSQPFPSQANLRPTPARPVRPLPPSVVNHSTTSRRRSSGEGKVWDQIAALEDAESSREEDAKVLQSLQSESVKRKASVGDLRGTGFAPRIVYGSSPAMIPSGTRALDRPIGDRPKPRHS